MGEKGISLPESLVAILSERKAHQRSRLFVPRNQWLRHSPDSSPRLLPAAG